MIASQKRDYVSMWFKARKELGISDAMNIAKLNICNKSIKWSTFSHTETDGLGGVAKALREDGYKCKNLPTSSEKRPPSFFKILKYLLYKPKQNKPKEINWKYNYNTTLEEQGEIHYDFFSIEDTKSIRKNAKLNRVSFNHYILWALNKAIAKNLIADTKDYYWLYPVNLRGPLNFGTDYFNYSSSVNICVNRDMEPIQIHNCVKEQLKAKVYWINWYLANIGKLVGMSGIRFIYRLISKRQFYAGSFSFLGDWPLKEERNPNANLDDIYITCGIGTRNYPVSTGIIIWYDRLSLGIKLHPSICNDQKLSKKCLNDWMQLLLNNSHFEKP